MNIPIYQVDAFTTEIFGGNPAAICPLDHWLDTETMQKIAMENSVAETAFFVQKHNGFEIRWFTPEIEMDLCGHATLAAAHVIWEHLHHSNNAITFASKSGDLHVSQTDQSSHSKTRITLDFPSRMPAPASIPDELCGVFTIAPQEVYQSRDYVFVYDNEEQIRNLTPDTQLFDRINLDPGGLIITSKGETVDFVSRFFTPQASILEDPVTGSAHCSLIPFWAERLGKTTLTAQQLSHRQGTLWCESRGDRVSISGNALTYLIGHITLP